MLISAAPRSVRPTATVLLDRDLLQRLCRARERLGDVREAHLTVAAVARDAGISPYHFIRQFDAVFGQTPHQFRIRSRLDLAKHLLVHGDQSVTDVCLAVGFSSLGSFSDLFARRVGAPPSVYRRRARLFAPGLPPPPAGCLTLMWHLPPTAFRSFREA